MLRQLLAQSFPDASSAINISMADSYSASTNGVIMAASGSSLTEKLEVSTEDVISHQFHTAIQAEALKNQDSDTSNEASDSPEFAVLSKMQPTFGPSAPSAFHSLTAPAATATAPTAFMDPFYQSSCGIYSQQPTYGQPPPPNMDAMNGYLNGSTSDLFSSTYAVLASESVPGFPHVGTPTGMEWSGYASFDPSLAAAERLDRIQSATSYLLPGQPAILHQNPQVFNHSVVPATLLQYSSMVSQESALSSVSVPLVSENSNHITHPQQQAGLLIHHPPVSSNQILYAQQQPPYTQHLRDSPQLSTVQSEYVQYSTPKIEEPESEKMKSSIDSGKTHRKKSCDTTSRNCGDRKSPGMGNSKRASSQSVFTEAFRKITAQIPIDQICGAAVVDSRPKSRDKRSKEKSEGSSDEEDENGETRERVMCLACKGVYPSRRSLTGHIGRNEKCREIIGRNYLDQLAQLTSQDIIPDLSATDGVSPVCPYCDRFISHYKGNIRRHINQCKAKDRVEEVGGGGARRESTPTHESRGATSQPTDDPSPPATIETTSSSSSASSSASSSIDLPSICSNSSVAPTASSTFVPTSTPVAAQPTSNMMNSSGQIVTTSSHLHHQTQHAETNPGMGLNQLPMATTVPLSAVSHQAAPLFVQRHYEHTTIVQPHDYGHAPPVQQIYSAHTYDPGHAYMNGGPMQISVGKTEDDDYEPNGAHLMYAQQSQAYNRDSYAHESLHSTDIVSPQNISSSTQSKIAVHPSKPLSSSGKGHNQTTNSGANCANPYVCVWCSFSTAYKGNMKRHLISCHAVTDELLRRYSFEVERLRQSHPNRPAVDDLPITPRETVNNSSNGEKKSPTQKHPSNSSRKRAGEQSGNVSHRGRPKKCTKVDHEGEKIREDVDGNTNDSTAINSPQPHSTQVAAHIQQPVYHIAQDHMGHPNTSFASLPQSNQQLYVVMGPDGQHQFYGNPQQVLAQPQHFTNAVPTMPITGTAFRPHTISKEHFEGSNDSGISVQSFIQTTNPANL
ncbi:c2H2-type zinc-finger domain-containing protein [Ditylenchus destructor]|uniref:C2H2-type zinc-finger domain-containing protein n=1 Tax=Ditylenchus destructor TaxID=166010 RepID=A0AAD4RD44_9BILA|nr:c2H2-type zinc-finger domain-containing protein [Ditylenchus destructor]